VELPQIVEWLKAKEQRAKDEAIQFGEEHLPKLEALVGKIGANPVIDAIFKAEHLDPDWFASLADVIRKADAALAVAANARADAEARAAAAEAQPDVHEADPAPAG
jgi:hypothetical protein